MYRNKHTNSSYFTIVTLSLNTIIGGFITYDSNGQQQNNRNVIIYKEIKVLIQLGANSELKWQVANFTDYPDPKHVLKIKCGV